MRQKQFSVLEWAGSCEVCTKLPITTDFLCNWTPFRVITTFDFLAEINKLFLPQFWGGKKNRMCSEVAVKSFLCLNKVVNSHLNSFILITQQCWFSLLIHKGLFIDIPQDPAAAPQKQQFHWSFLFPREISFILYFVLSLFFTVNTACLLGREQKQSWKCQDSGGQAALFSGCGTGRG